MRETFFYYLLAFNEKNSFLVNDSFGYFPCNCSWCRSKAKNLSEGCSSVANGERHCSSNDRRCYHNRSTDDRYNLRNFRWAHRSGQSRYKKFYGQSANTLIYFSLSNDNTEAVYS